MIELIERRLSVTLLAASIRCGFSYLKRCSDNKLIDKHIEKSPEPKPVVIQAIRGTPLSPMQRRRVRRAKS